MVLVGGLVLEVGHMSWVGSSQGCAAYYFISSWMLVKYFYKTQYRELDWTAGRRCLTT